MSNRLPKDQQRVVKWLNSKAGRRWSRSAHSGSGNMVWLYSLKRDQEAVWNRDQVVFDPMDDVVAVYWGRLERDGSYHAEPRLTTEGFIPYGQPVE